MRLGEIRNILDAEVICGEQFLDREIDAAFACDLISEMLSSASSHVLLITSLTNPHVMHTAEVIDALGVIFVAGRKPSEELISTVRTDGSIPILLTSLPLFECCGLLFTHGIQGDKKRRS
jgi:predicted transcriptional regulator